MDWGALVNAATAASTVAANAEAARAAGRVQTANLNHANDTTAQQGYQTDKSVDLNALTAAANYALNRAGGIQGEQAANDAATKARAANAARGSALENAQDVQISGLPAGVHMANVSGGLRPSMFDANTRALGGQMTKQALLDQMAGPVKPFDATAPTLDVSKILNMTAPGPTPLPQASSLDNILANLGMYGGIAAPIAKGVIAQTQTPPYTETRGGVTVPSTVT